MKYIIPTIVFVALALLFACSKSTTAIDYGPYTIQSVFSNMAVVPKTFTINASSGGTFTGTSGAQYYFPPFSFERDSVSIFGDVQIQVAEYVTKSDMIFSCVLPFSNGTPFVTGGAFYLSAMQAGQQIVLARPAKYQVVFPKSTTPTPGMQLFLGRPDDTIFTNLVNWQLNTDTSMGSISYNADTITINTDSTHYNCAGVFITSPTYQKITLTITTPVKTFSDSIYAYACYDSLSMVWQLPKSVNHVITDSTVTNAPIHFVVFTVINGEFYSGILGAAPVAGTNYNLYLTKSSPNLLKSKIDAL